MADLTLTPNHPTSYQKRVYDLVSMIPKGQVASYGMIASLLPGVTARMVGYALAASVTNSDIHQKLPWQRVINSKGRLSIPGGVERQRALLMSEGIEFSASGVINFRQYRWDGPDAVWLEKNTIDLMDFMTIKAGWP